MYICLGVCYIFNIFGALNYHQKAAESLTLTAGLQGNITYP